MKKALCCVLLLVLLFIFCGCSQEEPSREIEVCSFSYASDSTYYKVGNPGVKDSGFVNTKETLVDSPEKAIKLAKNECKIEYDTINISFDSELSVYRVDFSKEGWTGGLSVYLTDKGITLLIVQGE